MSILKWTTAILTLVILVLFIYIQLTYDKVTFNAPYPEITASTDSTIIARGNYLVNGPAHCLGCHVPQSEYEKVNKGQIIPMIGGHAYHTPLAIFYSPNLTSDPETGLGNYTDAEIARALRFGVGKKGNALINFMPFQDVSDTDLTAIISYLRTLEPVKNTPPENEYTFMGKVVKRFLLKPVGPSYDIIPQAVFSSLEEKGEYIANRIANCRGCHSPRDLGTGEYTGEYFSGGLELPSIFDPEIIMVTPNISTDTETSVMARFTEETFIQRFRQGELIKGSTMPWAQFTRINEDDLKALWAYLITVAPVKQDNGPAIKN